MEGAVPDTCRMSSFEFSQDSSLIAAGSPESCIRLWSLKGEKLKSKRVGQFDLCRLR